MRKIFYLVAILGTMTIAFASCGKDDNGETRKLPSKITTSEGTHTWVETFEYDDLNRLIKTSWVSGNSTGGFEFFYEGSSNRPTRWNFRDNEYSSENALTFSGNLIINSSDTLVTNANGHLIEWRQGESRAVYEYNSHGDITKITWNETDEIIFSYSNEKAIFGHVNIPSWLTIWALDGFHFLARAYMPSVINRGTGSWTFVYTSSDGYVNKITQTYAMSGASAETRTMTIEYIDAR